MDACKGARRKAGTLVKLACVVQRVFRKRALMLLFPLLSRIR